MLKIRLQGTKSDIDWYRRNLEQDKNIHIIQFSDPYINKGTKKFVRVYVEIEKIEKIVQ